VTEDARCSEKLFGSATGQHHVGDQQEGRQGIEMAIWKWVQFMRTVTIISLMMFKMMVMMMKKKARTRWPAAIG
jgi:hypothetical protein